MTTDTARLLASLDTVVHDTMRLLADCAEDEGDVATAAGWRWLAQRRKRPESNSAAGPYVWYAAENEWQVQHCLNRLPAELDDVYTEVRPTLGPAKTRYLKEFPSASAALLAAARGIGEWLAKGGK